MSWQNCAPQSDRGTEWEEILRKKGIMDPHIKEDELAEVVDQTVEEKLAAASASSGKKDMADMNLEELAAAEDDVDSEDEKFLEAYRRQRLAEMRDTAAKSRFGQVREISRADWKREVNEAGQDVPVVVLITRQGLVGSKLLEDCHRRLAAKFPQVKFVRGEADNCIPNYPDKNVPTVLLYKNDGLVKQWIGLDNFGGGKASPDALEWMLSKEGGVLQTDLESDPRLAAKSKQQQQEDEQDSDDDY